MVAGAEQLPFGIPVLLAHDAVIGEAYAFTDVTFGA